MFEKIVGIGFSTMGNILRVMTFFTPFKEHNVYTLKSGMKCSFIAKGEEDLVASGPGY